MTTQNKKSHGAPAARTRNERNDTRSLVLNGELVIYGTIDPYSWSGDSIRAIDVMGSLQELSGKDRIVCRINSPGGEVMEGLAIYNALRACGKPIEVRVDAMAASIASVIAMAGDEIIMAENSSIMIHDVWGAAFGNAEDMRSMADEIDRETGIIVNLYARRTGLEPEEIRAMMAAETYMSASEAVEKGFATKVAEAMKTAACAMLTRDQLARLLRARNEIPQPAAKPDAGEAAPAAQPQAAETANSSGATTMTTKTAQQAADTPAAGADATVTGHTAADLEAARAEATRVERERVSGITMACRAAKLDQSFIDALINDEKVTLNVAREKIINKWAEDQVKKEGTTAPDRGQSAEITEDAVDRWQKGVTQALAVRGGLATAEEKEKARSNEFMGLSLPEMARSALDLRNQKNRHMPKMVMVGEAFTTRNSGPGYHSTSDFGNALAMTAQRAVAKGYEEVEETFHLWTAKGQASDFRPINRVDMGLFPGLDKVEEGGEYTYGTMGDSTTQVQIATYGKMFAITRQAIINDDLQFFDKVPRKMGRGAKRTIGNLVYAILNANPTMQDGTALFHALHGNLAGSGGVASITTLGAAQVAMALQKDDGGIGTALGVVPEFALIPPTQGMLFKTLMTAANTPGDAGQIPNPVQGLVKPITDSRLSGTAWYLAGNPNQVDTIEVTYLDGVEEPYLEQQQGWNVDGVQFKVRIDAGVKALHWRGLYKNAGA